HAHFIPKAFGDFMGDRWGPRVGVPAKTGIAKHPVSDSIDDINGRLELMDAAGVGKQVLSPHRPPYLPDEAEGVRAIQLLNDGYTPLINDYKFTAAVGTSIEDACFVLHMIAKQIPHRYPNIKFIVPHLGGPVPMLLNRLDQQGQNPAHHPNLSEKPSVTAMK